MQKSPDGPLAMTSRYTNEEWAAIVAQTARDLRSTPSTYECPEVPSPAFFKTVDHTLLKLEARDVQFDELCAEARTDGFAVRRFLVADCRRLADAFVIRPFVFDRSMSSNAPRT